MSIDGAEFAREGRRLVGSVPIAELARLADTLTDSGGALDCALTGEQDREGNAYLLFDIAGRLQLCCQRCLESMAFKLRVHSRLRVVPVGTVVPDDEFDNDECDVIEAGKALELLPLLEDEILLALPLAPRHDVCGLPEAADNAAEAGAGGKPSPFAGLAKLKK